LIIIITCSNTVRHKSQTNKPDVLSDMHRQKLISTS